jgi:hypothetical protein
MKKKLTLTELARVDMTRVKAGEAPPMTPIPCITSCASTGSFAAGEANPTCYCNLSWDFAGNIV